MSRNKPAQAADLALAEANYEPCTGSLDHFWLGCMDGMPGVRGCDCTECISEAWEYDDYGNLMNRQDCLDLFADCYYREAYAETEYWDWADAREAAQAEAAEAEEFKEGWLQAA